MSSRLSCHVMCLAHVHPSERHCKLLKAREMMAKDAEQLCEPGIKNEAIRACKGTYKAVMGALNKVCSPPKIIVCRFWGYEQISFTGSTGTENTIVRF